MKRSKGLRRRTALKAKTSLRSTATLARTASLDRDTPLAKVGAKGKREAEAIKAFRSAVFERAGGHCERCGIQPPKGDLHAHHLKPRGRGGRHVVENGAALCGACHTKIHEHAKDCADWHEWLR
jgi:5-methylcytosine-specific restriction endonuclease McrA